MESNKRIRAQVLSDLKQALNASALEPVRAWFDGFPSNELSEAELTAIAVSLQEGESVSADMEEETWEGLLVIRIIIKSEFNVDAKLDSYGEVIRKALNTSYNAGGLLENCNRSSYQYQRDEIAPWGTLDLAFTIEYTEEV
ncbi:phage tail terminator protein [Vibrio parahaemolyticus]|uniref:phage tail terminator protein n=1 Tax=Vibrio parahaemolyticus TaxID=670 RepID=UPI000413F3E1|nr:phage tail terminator protein [Vibrio parahaemolyticus]